MIDRYSNRCKFDLSAKPPHEKHTVRSVRVFNRKMRIEKLTEWEWLSELEGSFQSIRSIRNIWICAWEAINQKNENAMKTKTKKHDASNENSNKRWTHYTIVTLGGSEGIVPVSRLLFKSLFLESVSSKLREWDISKTQNTAKTNIRSRLVRPTSGGIVPVSEFELR